MEKLHLFSLTNWITWLINAACDICSLFLVLILVVLYIILIVGVNLGLNIAFGAKKEVYINESQVN